LGNVFRFPGKYYNIQSPTFVGQFSIAYVLTHTQLQPAEIEQVKTGIDDQTVFQANGVRIAGKKYFFLRGEPGERVYAKGSVCLIAISPRMCG
jgi:hypothetical protein